MAEEFPPFAVLAEAPPAEVSHTWRPLGYNIRRSGCVDRATGRREYDGKLPSDRDTLLSFHGIGDTPPGDPQLRFRERAAILDTNVARALQDLRRQRRSEKPRDEKRL